MVTEVVGRVEAATTEAATTTTTTAAATTTTTTVATTTTTTTTEGASRRWGIFGHSVGGVEVFLQQGRFVLELN